MTNTAQIVLIEDDAQIRRFVTMALQQKNQEQNNEQQHNQEQQENYKIYQAENGQRGLIEAGTRKPDLLILDLGLPDMDGNDVIREFRSWSDVPILILSARTDEQDKIIALDLGADDYLTKPFGVGELLARVRALIRRRMRGHDHGPVWQFADISVDFSRRTVQRNGEDARLTPIEYRLLCVFAANAGKVMTHRFLMREVWGPNHTESSHYLRIYVSHLRQKLEKDPTQPVHFLTQTGVGYRFEP